jgi:hypothetical protein
MGDDPYQIRDDLAGAKRACWRERGALLAAEIPSERTKSIAAQRRTNLGMLPMRD